MAAMPMQARYCQARFCVGGDYKCAGRSKHSACFSCEVWVARQISERPLRWLQSTRYLIYCHEPGHAGLRLFLSSVSGDVEYAAPRRMQLVLAADFPRLVGPGYPKCGSEGWQCWYYSGSLISLEPPLRTGFSACVDKPYSFSGTTHTRKQFSRVFTH